MEIINRIVNFKPNTCQFVSENQKICDISTNNVNMISAPFEELRKDGELTSSKDDLKLATVRVIERQNTLKRIKRKEENGGYVLVGSLTCLGTLVIGIIIFMAIKFIVMG